MASAFLWFGVGGGAAEVVVDGLTAVVADALAEALALFGRLDLVAMLQDRQALQKLTIIYDSPTQHGFQLLFVHGGGSLVLQTYPGRPDDFSAIELHLQKLAESAFSNKPCHLAPAEKF